MKHRVKIAWLLTVGTVVSGAAMAHPGDHATLPAAEAASHFAADPWHVALMATGALLAAGLARLAWRTRGSRS